MHLRTKEAVSRLDREVAKGNVSYSDLGKFAPTPVRGSDDLDFAKAQVRRNLYNPELTTTPANPAALARTREMKQRLYEAQVAHGNREGLHNISTHPLIGSIHQRMLPGMGPATVAGQIFAPPTSGAFLRSAVGSGDPRRLLASSITGALPGAIPAQATNQLLGGARPEDKTLNLAVMQHELGEAEAMHGLTGAKRDLGVMPVASHLGVRPIVRENLALTGDPEAQALMSSARMRDPGDYEIQRLIRQVGGTSEAPIPLGGRQERALERGLSRSVAKAPGKILSPMARQNAVKLEALHQALGGPLGEASPLGYKLPEGAVPKSIKEIPALAENVLRNVKRKNWETLYNIYETQFPHILDDIRRSSEFLQGGTVRPAAKASIPTINPRALELLRRIKSIGSKLKR